MQLLSYFRRSTIQFLWEWLRPLNNAIFRVYYLSPPFWIGLPNYLTKKWLMRNLRVKPRRLPFILHLPARALAWTEMCYHNQFINRKSPESASSLHIGHSLIESTFPATSISVPSYSHHKRPNEGRHRILASINMHAVLQVWILSENSHDIS